MRKITSSVFLKNRCTRRNRCTTSAKQKTNTTQNLILNAVQKPVPTCNIRLSTRSIEQVMVQVMVQFFSHETQLKQKSINRNVT